MFVGSIASPRVGLGDQNVKLPQASALHVCCCDALGPPGGAKGLPSASSQAGNSGDSRMGFEDISGESFLCLTIFALALFSF